MAQWVMAGMDLSAGAYWIVDDTGFPKKGAHSVGVARQYCGQLGKQDNCQVAVSVSLATEAASVPVAYRLYLPQQWAGDRARRVKAGVPPEVRFATKGQIALAQLEHPLRAGAPRHCVLADAAYGTDSYFRLRLSELGLAYVVGIVCSLSVWPPGVDPLPAKPYSGRGRPPLAPRRQPLSVSALAHSLPIVPSPLVIKKEVVSLHRIASVRLEISRQFFLGIPLMLMGLSLQADHGVLSVVALVAIVFAALLLWGSPTVVMNAAGHGRKVQKGWPWQCSEAMAFVETLRVRLVHDKAAKSTLRRH